MKTICAWCSTEITPPTGDDPALRVSHGICKPCAAALEAEARELDRRVNAVVRRLMPACQSVAGL